MRGALRRRTLWLPLLSLATALVLVLQGCGGSSGGTETGGGGASVSETGGAASEGQAGGAAEGKRVLRATFAWPLKIDPAIGTDEAASTALVNLYSSLVYPTASGEVQPYVAESWDVSDDHLTYTFHLRKGVKFHDGTELTSADVKFSFERLMAIGQGFSYLFKGRVASVETPDPYTVIFKLTKPFGPFLSTLPRLYIVNSALVKANEAAGGSYGENGDYGMAYLNAHDAGSGAYEVEEFDIATHITMKKFPDFFAERDPDSPDEFTMIGTTEASTVRTGMANGTIDISDQWQTAEAYDALAKLPGVKVAAFADGGQMYLMMNTKKAPTDDLHVRKALSMLLDYDVITKDIFPGTQISHGPVSGVLPGADATIPALSFDLDGAKAELAASKYAGKLDQYPVVFEWTAEVPSEEKIALMLQANAQKVGLNVKIVKTPWTTIIEHVSKPETTPNLVSIQVAPDYGEAGSMLDIKYSIANQGSWQETEWLGDKEIDSMIADALSTIDTQERLAKYKAIERKVMELLPSIPAFDTVAHHAYRADYITWKQLDDPIPVLGYMFDARFIAVKPH